jgi:hypothetical protein
MPILTIIVGDILTTLGIVTYFMWQQFGAAHQSATALIPAYFGIALNIVGGLALLPKFRMHAMHVAVVIALIGFCGAAGRLIAKPQAAGTVGGISQIIMAVVTGIYVALCVRSFIAARRARQAQSPNP